MNTPTRTLTVAALLAAGLCAGIATAQTPAATHPMADQVFKNVRALKGLSVDDFMETMGLISAALSFDCSDCHYNAGTPKVDWAADTPRKVVARTMINMVAGINKNNFGGRQMVSKAGVTSGLSRLRWQVQHVTI